MNNRKIDKRFDSSAFALKKFVWLGIVCFTKLILQ